MTLTRRARIGGPVLHPRLCAAVVAGSSAVHMWLAVQNQHGALLSVLMLALAAVCLPCAVHIWRHNRVGALRRVMACAVSMAAVHGVLLLCGGSGGHAHAGVPPSNVAGPNIADAAGPGLLLVIGLEITTALLAATLVARLRSVPHPN